MTYMYIFSAISAPTPQFEAHSGSPSSQYLPPLHREEGVWYRTHHRVVFFSQKSWGNRMHIVYTQWLSFFLRQLYDACDNRPLPLYAKGVGIETRLTPLLHQC